MTGPVIVDHVLPEPDFVNRQLEPVADLLARLAEPYGFASLLLSGSLGRGEGACLMTAEGPRLFNDVDLVLVTAERVPAAIVQSWEEQSTALLCPGSRYRRHSLSALGLHVDLLAIPRGRLGRLGRTLFNFDLRSSRVLVGADVRAEISVFPEDRIPRQEALVLLGNRSLSLCESASAPGSDSAGLWMRYHALKAVIDSGAALLMLAGRYASHHREQCSRLPQALAGAFPTLAEQLPGLPTAVRAAVEERQRLRCGEPWAEQVQEWRSGRDLILSVFRHATANVLGLAPDMSWPCISDKLRRWWLSPGCFIERYGAAIGIPRWARSFRRRYRQGAALYGAAPHLLAAVEPGDATPAARRADLARAASLLTIGISPDEGAWEAVRDVAVDRWKSAA